MGQNLVQMYDFVTKHGGPKARMRLAMMTCIASAIAEDTKETPELLGRFRTAVQEITGKQAPA